MMKGLDLSEKWTKELSAKPETGAGFRDVRVTTKSGGKIDGLVTNGTRLETLMPVREDDIASIEVKGSKRHA